MILWKSGERECRRVMEGGEKVRGTGFGGEKRGGDKRRGKLGDEEG